MSPRDAAVLWFEPAVDWRWPGRGEGTPAVAVELIPPIWVPAQPAPLPAPISALVVSAPSAPARRAQPAQPRGLARKAVLLSIAFAVFLALFTYFDPRTAPQHVASARVAARAVAVAHARPAERLPALGGLQLDAAGSGIASVVYHSKALPGTGSFLVYLPPGYSASSGMRYPVLYLLHGNGQHADSFLEIGVQSVLDHLISTRSIGPLIAVMINGGPGTNNWRNVGSGHYANYVVEVQGLVDRMLPTLAERSARGIAGFSMGGYGAMNIALMNPGRFGVTESWLGFFNGLGGELQGDAPVLAHEPMHAFLWGASGDRIADPSENASFAAQLRAAGVDARSAVYAGEHDFATLSSHLVRMMTFAAQELSPATPTS